jgi:nucleotide-binding universal stress UspA family protein
VRWLRELASTLDAGDLEIAVDARWDSPLADGIVRKAVESGAGIVVKDTHYHPVLKRSLFSNTDWNLIGNTAEEVLDKLPCDLLIVRPDGSQTSVPL